tara:strand:- start:347 stop:583 length:237 start_codon:yes stop_codon:yes gene_type:complete
MSKKLNLENFIDKIVDIINNDINENNKEKYIEELRDWCEGILVQFEDPEHFMYHNSINQQPESEEEEKIIKYMCENID